MSIQQNPPKPLGNSWLNYAQRLSAYLVQVRSQLRHKGTGESAAEDGVLLWDRDGYPVISKGGEFRQLVLANGYGTFLVDADVSPAVINTPYPIVFSRELVSSGVVLGTPASRIIANEAGWYLLTFTVRLTSSSASVKNVKFWARRNGVDVPDYTIDVNVEGSSAATVMTRDAWVYFSAGDYLEAVYASDSLDIKLDAVPATAYSPTGAAVIVTMLRIRQ